MFDNIRGVITFEAVAAEPEKFANMLKTSAVSVYDMRTERGKIYGNIYKSDFEDVKKIAKSCGAQICIFSKKGLFFTLFKYRRRIGMIIGLILAFMVTVYLSNVVMIVEVYGNETLTDKQVESILKDYGISIGSFIPSIDLREAERLITSSVDNIAWIGLRSTGCKIQAEISETVSPPKIIPTSVPCNIVSSRDAQIVDIKNVHMGMLIPMLYDGVKKGDILISGTVEDGKGGVYYAHSMGEIIGRYTEKVVFQQQFTDNRYEYGNEIHRKTFYFFGLKIPLYICKNNFENYEYDEEIRYVKLWNIQFPIGVILSDYKTYEIKQITYNSEQVKAILEDKIKLYEYNFFDDGDINIIDKEIYFSESNDKIVAVVKYTLESDIGITQEIMN